MKHLNKGIITLTLILFSSQMPLWCNPINARIEYFANIYHVTDQKNFLKKIIESKNPQVFLKNNEKEINKASKNLLEAAYWLANDQKKLDLAQELLFIIDSK